MCSTAILRTRARAASARVLLPSPFTHSSALVSLENTWPNSQPIINMWSSWRNRRDMFSPKMIQFLYRKHLYFIPTRRRCWMRSRTSAKVSLDIHLYVIRARVRAEQTTTDRYTLKKTNTKYRFICFCTHSGHANANQHIE